MFRKPYFNCRHGRHSHLFQNRYKSILCQEDAYLLELVRPIHLNPLRAGLVKDLNQLVKNPFSGHAVILSKIDHPWQHTKGVLALFSRQLGPARRKYRSFVAKGISDGRRSDLVGGGLVRSSGGWAAVKAMRVVKAHMKSDERILGDGDFVAEMLARNNETFDRQYLLKAKGVDFDYIVRKVAQLYEMTPDEVWRPGRYKQLVTARSLLCYWAVRERGISMASMSRRLGISTVAVSKSVHRGAAIAEENGYHLEKLIS